MVMDGEVIDGSCCLTTGGGNGASRRLSQRKNYTRSEQRCPLVFSVPSYFIIYNVLMDDKNYKTSGEVHHLRRLLPRV